MPSATLVLAFGTVLVAGILLTSALRGRSIGEILHGITSPHPEEAQAALGNEPENAPPGGGSPSKNPDKDVFTATLASLTGLSLQTVRAWANHEQGDSTVEGGNNWLNVEAGPRGSGSEQIHGPEAKYVESLSARNAAKYTAEWLKHYQPGILAAAGHGSSAEVTAIEDSGFAGSHYGNESPSVFLSAA